MATEDFLRARLDQMIDRLGVAQGYDRYDRGDQGGQAGGVRADDCRHDGPAESDRLQGHAAAEVLHGYSRRHAGQRMHHDQNLHTSGHPRHRVM